MSEKTERDHYSFTGENAQESPDGIVSGHTDSPETEATQAEMRKREQISETLDALQEKYGQYEEIQRIFEDTSGLTSQTERVHAVIDGLNELTRELDKQADIESDSKRRRISIIVNKLRELI